MAKTPGRQLADVIGHRSEALAQVVLTRLPEVLPVRVDIGDIDFFAFLSSRENEEERFRFFAVIVKGAKQLGSVTAANNLGKTLRANLTDKVYIFPTIVLACSMEDEKVFYAWHMEPFVENNVPKLSKHRNMEFAEFTVDALKDTVERVDEWYDSTIHEIVS
jgi:hypothetical protein